MRKLVATPLIAFLLLSGCASTEQWTKYHSSIDKQTAAVLAYSKAQEQTKAANRAAMMSHYSQAMTQAAITPASTDDVLLAFAWGVEIATPDEYNQPKLPSITPPDKTSDLWKAATPVVAMAMPFLYMIPWANNSSSGTTISASDNARVNLDSQNAGSYNRAGGNLTAETTTTRNGDENCLDCGQDEGGAEVEGGEPVNPIEGGDTCEVSGGYFNSVDGKYYADEFFTCSCGSRDAKEC